MHRFAWDLRYQPVVEQNPQQVGDVDATGAVPHRSEHAAAAPWAPPGRYVVRLRAGDRTLTQPLTLRLDPRIRTPAAGLRQLAALSRQMYNAAVTAHAAYKEARARIESLSGTLRAQVESLAPAPRAQRGRGFGQPGATAPPTLESASQAALAAAMAMQDGDLTPTAAQVAACARARAQVSQVMTKWGRLNRRTR